MIDGAWHQLTIHDPRDVREGDVVRRAVQDYLSPERLIDLGDWLVMEPNYICGNYIGVDDEGRAYDVAAIHRHCRSLATERDEWVAFPMDRPVAVRRQCGARRARPE
ncbi:hypothetical protein DP939_20100 [Spongiactinospora rosea]|uniref:Uncharacterized protein n=1 Tax=Spongiactinospora rosea TaxID=2248750 RepID=A0A366LXD3_9ACTN|nr:hypothetical protein [Spongiactinospora rosea]RBQ18203.1 hypothetical protein DP939_20100 [Spongiactinospora rosea]